MSKTKRLLSMLLVVALVAGIAISGTLAYLTSTDSDVNVMTLGNVQIEQIEQEWNSDKTELQEFTQGKPLYPYVGKLGWENTTEEDGAYRRFTMNNVVDKYVSVKNTGASDAYVRTIIALEMGDFAYEEFNKVGVSINKINGDEFKFADTWEWTDDFAAEIDGKNYNIMVAVHEAPVASGATTIPSLLQVYLSKDATNEDCEKLDGNKNGTYDILVLSQAVQTAGFPDAATALNTGFGEVNAENAENVAKWFMGVIEENKPGVKNTDELKEAVEEGGNVVLGANFEVTEMIEIPKNVSVSIDGQGYTLTRADSYTGTILSLGEYAELTLSNITLDGENVESTGNLIYIDSFGKLTLNDGTVLENHVGGTTYENDPYRGPENSVIHCDGETVIVMNDGSVIRNNVAKGNFATVIMSSYGVTCELNGGKIINNTSEKNNYTVWFGNYANVTVSDGFEMSDNVDGGLMRVNQNTSFTMNGGKLDGNGKPAIYTWAAKYVTLNGGEIVGNVSLNYTPATVGGTDVNGVIYKDNEVTKWALNLTPDFNTVRYSIAGNITQLNIVPAEGYTYAEGDEDKLICENAGYETYWDAENGCFKVQASN